MTKSKLKNTLVEQSIIDKIHLIRGQKVRIENDLTGLNGVETKRLKV